MQWNNKPGQSYLNVSGKEIKYFTVNMLNINLIYINISKNKISKLPVELC